MVLPRVADIGDGLQVWRKAKKTLNKQSRTVDKGWSWRLCEGLTTSHHKKQLVTKS